MSAVLWSYYYHTTMTEPPAVYQILLDAGHPYTATTKAWLSVTTASSLNVAATLLQMPVGAVLHVQDHQYSDRWGQFEVTGPVLDKTTYVEVPVTWLSNGANLYNGPIVEVLFVSSIDLAPPPAGGLVSFVDAKDHLRITDTDHDADIAQKLTEATATILDYLKDRADPAWTEATVPGPVAAAIKLHLGYLYDGNRGDNPDKDAEHWAGLARLLMRLRDPALA